MSKKDNLAKKLIDNQPEDQEIQQKSEALDSSNIEEMAVLKSAQAKKFQIMSKTGVKSPSLQVNLLQSESLRIAQEKIVDLEKEVECLRRDNEALTSSGSVLKETIDGLNAKLDDSRHCWEDEKASFIEEKKVLITTLDDVTKQVNILEGHKKELENRLSKDFQNIRVRENSLENRLEILKLEGSVLQREKNNKIIELQKKINKLNDSLQTSHKKNKEIQSYIAKLKDSSRKTVSVLRATIYNLEGYRVKESSETQSDIPEEDQD